VTHPEDWKHEQEMIRQRVSRETDDYLVEKRYIRKDGEVRHVVVAGEILELESPTSMIALAMALDITERKRAEEALRRSEETARALINATNESAALLSPYGTVLMANTTFARALGFEDTFAICGKNAFSLIPPDLSRARREHFELAQSSGSSVMFEDTRDGKHIQNTVYPILDENGHIQSVAVFGMDVTRQRRLEEDLKASGEELRQLARRVQEAREEERTAIARELHDQVGQTLTALKLDLSQLKKKLGSVEPGIALSLAVMDSLLDESAADVRRISSELRPGVLDDLGLEGAIEWHVDQLRQRSEIVFSLDLPAKRGTLDSSRSTVLYRVYQELITNVLRHAHATTVSISLSYERDRAVMVVSDDGRGIPAGHDRAPSSLGLVGIRERLNPFKGELHISGDTGKGTIARVVMPVA